MSCRYANAKYMTIAEIIARRLRAGEFQPPGQFYSRDELARAYHISPGTARAVLRVLEDRGVISCRKGKRSIPACIADKQIGLSAYRPVFVRDSYTAETPEYDFLAYCAQNLLMRRKIGFLERDPNHTEDSGPVLLSAGDVAVVFPTAADSGKTPENTLFRPEDARIDVLVDQTGSNTVSVFTRMACLDCVLHLIRHNVSRALRVARHSAFQWFGGIAVPGAFNEYAPDSEAWTIFFDDEPEMFPDFLTESISAYETTDHRFTAVLIDDPYLSDYLSGEIRIGAYRPPSRCTFFGTAFNERSMMFPYLDLSLDSLAASILRTACTKAETPSADLPCEFHLIRFRGPGAV